MDKSSVFYKIRRKMQVVAAKIFSKEFLNKIYTKIICGYKPNIRDPKTFNEKIQWLKIYFFPNNQKAIDMTDKVKIHYVVKQMDINVKLPKIYFETHDAKDIPWNDLPNKFVLKCNHGCRYNMVCKNKDEIDKTKVEKQFNKWIKEDFGLFNVEPHYSSIERKIFAEEYLGENLIDYKFFCFNGQPKFLYVSENLINSSNSNRISYFDLDWNIIPVIRSDHNSFMKGDIEKPDCFERLICLSKELSKDFPFVRVDFYVINDEPVLSEMTFTPSAGMMPINPRSYDEEWGKYLDIDDLLNKK